MQRSTTAEKANSNSRTNSSAANNQQSFQRPNQSPNFFQRNPLLSTFGAAIAGSWIGHMLFGGSGFGSNAMNGVSDAGAQASSGGSMMLNLLFMAIGAFLMVKLVKFLTRSQSCQTSDNQSQTAENHPTNIYDIQISESENQKFAEILLEIQTAWSSQNIDKLKRLTTPEMAKYFSDALSQNTSQGIANKMENIEVISAKLAESWKEDEMEYATVVLEWSGLDYVINLNKNPSDSDFIVEGNNKNLVIASEVWTFTRYNSQANWILSAIAQVESASGF
jgi:predicted lipid-binding transport protein (Tim44 family)